MRGLKRPYEPEQKMPRSRNGNRIPVERGAVTCGGGEARQEARIPELQRCQARLCNCLGQGAGECKKNLCLCTPLHYSGRHSAAKQPVTTRDHACSAWNHVFHALGHVDRKSREPQYVRWRAATCCALFGRYSATELAAASGYDRATIYYHARMHAQNMRYYPGYAAAYARVCAITESLYT